MANDSKLLPVSIYCVWQWWQQHYQRHHGRPKEIDYDWLDRHYLGRRRFLFEKFGRFGVGEEEPELDKNFVSKLLPYHTVIVPVLLGTKVSIQQEGGYCWQGLSEEEIRKIKPIDMANSPVGELIHREYQKLKSRYGLVTQMIDLASATNNAFILRGPEFYANLLVEKEFARQYLGVITETMCLAYQFITKLFGPMDGFPLGNCNVTMISPQLYIDMIHEHDIHCVRFAANLAKKAPSCNLHHCNVKTEPFAQAYRSIPGLKSLQGSCLSDMEIIHAVLPEVSFSAMVNPVDLISKPARAVEEQLEYCISRGAADLAIWDIDTSFGPDNMVALFSRIEEIATKFHRTAVFDVIPFTWEELDWEFPVYHR
jgi:hypothetical protein